MSTAPVVSVRHALGLPAGSVRALLALGVLALLWAVVLLTAGQQLPKEFTYLHTLMVLILSTYFASHGKTIGGQTDSRGPLHLPQGSIRFLLLAGYLGLAWHLFTTGHSFATPKEEDYPFQTVLLMSGFFLGNVLSGVVVRVAGGVPSWFQDLQAWLSLLAMVGLAIVAVVYVVIRPELQQDLKIEVPTLEAILAAVIGFYFGSRA